jgi:hypothetical protein
MSGLPTIPDGKMKLVLAAIEADGFVGGKYGTVPYYVEAPPSFYKDEVVDGGAVDVRSLDHRLMLRIFVRTNGELFKDFHLAEWLNPKPPMWFEGQIDPALLLFPEPDWKKRIADMWRECADRVAEGLGYD